MRTLGRVATNSLAALCIGLALVVVAVAAIGILGTRSSTILGKEIASDELATSTATAELARDMDTAYATGEEAFLASDSAQRARLLGSLYTSLLPAADAQLSALEQLHAGDPPAEHADIELFVRQWIVVRDLLSPTNVAARPAATLASRLAAAYLPVGAHLDRLFSKEQHDGDVDRADASANGERTSWLVIGVAVVGIMLGILLLLHGIRRVRRTMEPGEDQAEFAEILQIANDEDEAHQLLQRHLERMLAPATAVVLNRNNSADRLEAATPLPSGSPLAETLRGAKPRSCLAARSGRTHREGSGRSALLSCPVCAPCRGTSSCVPLVVGGEVIGSVLLIRPARYDQADEQRIHESISQAAPVLANLRNLAIAEIRAATDGLTGLPNKRAVADALKRMFAQASTIRSPLAFLLLDLDHFKQVNDQRGHPVGDQILANVGAVLRSTLRTQDFAGRNGGEEFAILLPDTEIRAALGIAERVRAAVAEISLPGTDVAVTASIGVAGFPDHASTPDRLERLADAALYLAKRQGRNRVEVAEPMAIDTFAGFSEPPATDSAPENSKSLARTDAWFPSTINRLPGCGPALTAGASHQFPRSTPSNLLTCPDRERMTPWLRPLCPSSSPGLHTGRDPDMAAASYPDDLRYHREHGWARVQGDEATRGITWYAQDSLGEVVYFDPPEVGSEVTKDQPYGQIESVKTVSDLFAPLSGEIVQVNDALGSAPKTVNEDSYGQGWLVKVKLSDPSEADSLMSAEEYQATLRS